MYLDKDKQIIFKKLVDTYPKFNSVLDVGGGLGDASLDFAGIGKEVTYIDRVNMIPIKQDNITIIENDFTEVYIGKFDAIWCSHVLEHQPNVNDFLKHLKTHLTENGTLVLIVPPPKDKVVSGHINMWNAGILLYALVMAGFDCSKAKVKEIGYNIAVIVKNRTAVLPKLNPDKYELTALKSFFPDVNWENKKNVYTFDGVIKELNWE